MPDFYVVVSKLRPAIPIPELCGKLYARNASEAEIEVGRYRATLNYSTVEWMGYDFHIVFSANEREARDTKYFRKWKHNRVTKRVDKFTRDLNSMSHKTIAKTDHSNLPSRRATATGNNGKRYSLKAHNRG